MTGRKTGAPLQISDWRMVSRIYGLRFVFALYHRDAQGGKDSLLTSVSGADLPGLGPQPLAFDQLGVIQERMGNRSDNNAPRNTYETRDRKWVAISTNSCNCGGSNRFAAERQPQVIHGASP